MHICTARRTPCAAAVVDEGGFAGLLHARPVPLKTLFLVCVLFAGASVVSHESGLDLELARHLQALQGAAGGGFPWRHSFWLSTVLHDGGRALVKRLYFLNLFLLLASCFAPRLRPWRAAFLYVALATLLSTSVVGLVKHSTTLPCPYSLVEFGGDRQWVDFSQLFSPDLPRGKCYPAGHASGGYAWLCLAFLFPWRSRRFYAALLPGALLGLCFGVSQQLRGAHFLSHDLLTIALCWLVSGLVFRLLHRALRWRGAAGAGNAAAASSGEAVEGCEAPAAPPALTTPPGPADA